MATNKLWFLRLCSRYAHAHYGSQMTDRLLYCGDHRSQKKRRDQRLLPARSPLPPCTFVCFTLKMNINFSCPNIHMYLRARLELTRICFLSNCNHIVWTVSLLCIGDLDNDFFVFQVMLITSWFQQTRRYTPLWLFLIATSKLIKKDVNVINNLTDVFFSIFSMCFKHSRFSNYQNTTFEK